MTEQNDIALFGALVLSLHAAGMQQLGKVINPITGKVEKDLEQAKSTIDMMEMLKRRTESNLSEDEKTLLSRLLYELQMNYVDEAKQSENSGTEEPAESKTNNGDNDESDSDE